MKKILSLLIALAIMVTMLAVVPVSAEEISGADESVTAGTANDGAVEDTTTEDVTDATLGTESNPIKIESYNFDTVLPANSWTYFEGKIGGMDLYITNFDKAEIDVHTVISEIAGTSQEDVYVKDFFPIDALDSEATITFWILNFSGFDAKINLKFAYPEGTDSNPMNVSNVDSLATDLDEGDKDGVTYSWTANEDKTARLYVSNALEGTEVEITATVGANVYKLSENGIDNGEIKFLEFDVFCGEDVIINVSAVPVEGVYNAAYVVVSDLEIKAGDVNEDGILTTSDVALIRRHIANWQDLDMNLAYADYNSDNEINTKDVVVIRRTIAGFYEEEEKPTVEYITTQDSFDAALSNTNVGDVINLGSGKFTLPNELPEGITIMGTVGTVIVNADENTGLSLNNLKDVVFDTVKFENDNLVALTFNGSAIFNNCIFDGASAVKPATVSDEVTFNNCSFIGAVYALNILGNGKVAINDCLVSGWSSFANGLDVSIDNTTFKAGKFYSQLRFYNDATVSNSTFDCDYVIDVQNNDVTVKLDNCVVSDGCDISNLLDVAVFEEFSSTAIINGRIYDFTPTKVETQEQLKDVIDNSTAGDTIILENGSYEIGDSIPSGVTIVGNGDTVISDKPVIKEDVKVENVIFKSEDDTSAVISGSGEFVDCTFEGTNGLYGSEVSDTVVFDGCVFKGEIYGAHFEGSGDVIFKNCVISGWTSFATDVNVYMENCVFEEHAVPEFNMLRIYGSAELVNCVFNPIMSIEAMENVVITLTDCTVTDEALTINDLIRFYDELTNESYIINGETFIQDETVADDDSTTEDETVTE